jgi:sugar phosphate isomerase/epimerase
VYLGYNTNGFAHHRLADALEILGKLGYQGVAITLDHHVLDPYGSEFEGERRRIREQLARQQLRCVIETGARFLLDPWRKHQPTLVSAAPAERERRADFLTRAIELAAFLDADAVSFWSGTALDDSPREVIVERFVNALEPVLAVAERHGVRLALEPEPDMLIDTLAAAEDLLRRLPHPKLGLTIDVGHLYCQSEGDLVTLLRRAGPALGNVHLEDMRRGVHDHLMFGDGEIDFSEVFSGLQRAGYAGGVFVELSRHSHDAVNTAQRAIDFLRRFL